MTYGGSTVNESVDVAMLKKELLRLLKEDEEFRYAVAGLIGLGEILKRLDRHEEELKKLREDLVKLREDFLTFVKEQEKRWEENNRRWEEANKRISRIELELGVLTESTYSRYIWEDLREEIVSRGEHIISRLRNTDIDGVEVDLLVETDKNIYVVEVKVKPSIEDIGDLMTKAEAVRQKLGKPVVPIIAGVLVGREVELYAKNRDVKIYRY